MNEKDLILEAMKKAGVPLNAGKIAELTGLDRGQDHERHEEGRLHRLARPLQVGARGEIKASAERRAARAAQIQRSPRRGKELP